MRTDGEIQEAVLRELKWDPRVDEAGIRVEVDRGIVTLSGTVDTFARRIAAQEAVHRVGGVLDVANDIRVRVAGELSRSDTELALAVRRALEWHVRVPQERIHTTVTDGLVTLEGSVEFWHEREDAERAVHHLTGVCGVLNRIEVTGPKPEPEDIQVEIEWALERRAERVARHITVSMRDGIARLSGPVHSWAEKEAVLGAARHTPGVRSVEDHLQIQPES